MASGLFLLAPPGESLAQEDESAGLMPSVLFVIERDRTMGEHWYGNDEMDTRWEVMIEAIADLVSTAPPSMPIAVITTSSASRDWYGIASFDDSHEQLVWNLGSTQLLNGESTGLASTLAAALGDYVGVEPNRPRPSRWQTSPFENPCSAVDLIVIGDAPGPRKNQRAPDEEFDGDVGGIAGARSAATPCWTTPPTLAPTWT
jgi:hypothetical protein